MRVSEKEYSLLETVRNTSDKYDSSIPLCYVVGDLARQELSETLTNDSNDDSEVEGVRF